MSTFEQLKDKNPHVTWIHADDPEFAPYGRVLDIDVSPYLKVVEEKLCRSGDNQGGIQCFKPRI